MPFRDQGLPDQEVAPIRRQWTYPVSVGHLQWSLQSCGILSAETRYKRGAGGRSNPTSTAIFSPRLNLRLDFRLSTTRFRLTFQHGSTDTSEHVSAISLRRQGRHADHTPDHRRRTLVKTSTSRSHQPPCSGSPVDRVYESRLGKDALAMCSSTHRATSIPPARVLSPRDVTECRDGRRRGVVA